MKEIHVTEDFKGLAKEERNCEIEESLGMFQKTSIPQNNSLDRGSLQTTISLLYLIQLIKFDQVELYKMT